MTVKLTKTVFIIFHFSPALWPLITSSWMQQRALLRVPCHDIKQVMSYHNHGILCHDYYCGNSNAKVGFLLIFAHITRYIYVLYRITGIVRGRKVSQISRIWKHSRMFSCTFFISAGIFIYEITWIAKVFSRTTAKKAICETFLPRTIPVIRYLVKSIVFLS